MNKPAPGQPQRSHYAVVAERNLFRPLIAPKERQNSPKLPASLLPFTPESSQPPQPPSPPPLPEETHNPANDGVAVVGSVKVGDEWHALVEEAATGKTCFVRVGESAFGYTVEAVGMDNAVLERDGQTFTVAVGENKVNTPLRSVSGTSKPFIPVGETVNGSDT